MPTDIQITENTKDATDSAVLQNPISDPTQALIEEQMAADAATLGLMNQTHNHPIESLVDEKSSQQETAMRSTAVFGQQNA